MVKSKYIFVLAFLFITITKFNNQKGIIVLSNNKYLKGETYDKDK